jgi:hypothetical protein
MMILPNDPITVVLIYPGDSWEHSEPIDLVFDTTMMRLAQVLRGADRTDRGLPMYFAIADDFNSGVALAEKFFRERKALVVIKGHKYRVAGTPLVWTKFQIFDKGSEKAWEWDIVAKDEASMKRGIEQAEDTWSVMSQGEFGEAKWTGLNNVEAALDTFVYYLSDAAAPIVDEIRADLDRHGWAYVNMP